MTQSDRSTRTCNSRRQATFVWFVVTVVNPENASVLGKLEKRLQKTLEDTAFSEADWPKN